MLTAKTTVIVGKKSYTKGQTVTGLSKIDREWMKLAGLIEEAAGKKETKKSEEAKDGL
ncbi:hypothetical protein [Roseburia hominis]|jgi:hypothetical protein|nr:MAG TPA: hypothetical protein [Caudoviricetes sp.]